MGWASSKGDAAVGAIFNFAKAFFGTVSLKQSVGRMPSHPETLSPIPTMGNIMALTVQMTLSENKLIGEKIVTPRLVNQQTLDYDAFCDYLAQGSTVTAADVSAVMKQLEKTLPVILALNAKVVASPEGLVFRPSVKGSITQSQLKAKLEQRKADYIANGDMASADKIDVNRELSASDLATSDLTAGIVIDLPKKWDSRFLQTVTFKRVTKANVVVEGNANGTDDEQNQGTNGNQTQGGGSTGEGQTSGSGGGSSTTDNDGSNGFG